MEHGFIAAARAACGAGPVPGCTRAALPLICLSEHTALRSDNLCIVCSSFVLAQQHLPGLRSHGYLQISNGTD